MPEPIFLDFSFPVFPQFSNHVLFLLINIQEEPLTGLGLLLDQTSDVFSGHSPPTFTIVMKGRASGTAVEAAGHGYESFARWVSAKEGDFISFGTNPLWMMDVKQPF